MATGTCGGSQHGREYPKQADMYELLEEIGQGNVTKVYRAKCKDFGDEVAVKVMQIDHVDSGQQVEIQREMQTMLRLSHPNLVKTYCSFVDSQHQLWLVMPYLGGGSAHHLMKWKHCKGLEEGVIAILLKGVLKACDYCHRNQLTHRDIKAGNILVGADGSVKLADFGLTASCRGSVDNLSLSWAYDTPCWMPPEQFLSSTNPESSGDIWAIGITILELVHGCEPFAKHSPQELLSMTLEDRAARTISRGLQEVLALCLQKVSSKRPTAAQLLEHRVIKEAKEKKYLVKHLLCEQPPLAERMQKVKKSEAQKLAQMTNNKTNNGGEKGHVGVDRVEKNRVEYKKGVEAWDFDPTELLAAFEREREQAQPPESKEVLGNKEEKDSGAPVCNIPSAAPVSPYKETEKGAELVTTDKVLPAKLLPPLTLLVPSQSCEGTLEEKEKGEAQHSLDLPTAKRVPKHKGRFDVYDEEEDPAGKGVAVPTNTPTCILNPSTPSSRGVNTSFSPATILEDQPEARLVPGGSSLSGNVSSRPVASAVSKEDGELAEKNTEVEKKTRKKGRFSIVQEDHNAERERRDSISVSKESGISSSENDRITEKVSKRVDSHPIQPIQPIQPAQPAQPPPPKASQTDLENWLLPKLQTLQAQQQAQQEAVAALVKHFANLEGQTGATDDKSRTNSVLFPFERYMDHEVMVTVTAAIKGAPPEQHEIALKKVVGMLEENTQLKRRNKELERKLNQSANRIEELEERAARKQAGGPGRPDDDSDDER
mmetsp:Transcript_30649/g.66907  ORF Transcript_30649/g.66907 Transcript_30649/m.66907 type:complete len:768 (-) Transcript_30649:53-2356(-)